MIFKYPRTRHIKGSNLQEGDHNLKTVSIKSIRNKYVVIEEKIDGANCGISFSNDGKLLLQSRGHFLTGGYRERHFDLFKMWAEVYKDRLYTLLGDVHVMYGEWMYAKHTVFYDLLPHYFMEFDIFNKEEKKFLSTKERHLMLAKYKFISSVPVIYTGYIESFKQLKELITNSLYKSDEWLLNLTKICEAKNLDLETLLRQTDTTNLAEGIYIKQETNEIVEDRYKVVRDDFTAKILSSDSHWLDRPIIENMLESGELEWT